MAVMKKRRERAARMAAMHGGPPPR
jgi:hypothetical protein